MNRHQNHEFKQKSIPDSINWGCSIMTELDEEISGVLGILEQYAPKLGSNTSLANYDRIPDDKGLYSYFEENPAEARKLVDELESLLNHTESPSLSELQDEQGPFPADSKPTYDIEEADASKIVSEGANGESNENTVSFEPNSIDLIITSPPYWQKRDYRIDDQLGQEETVEEYISNLIDALDHWKQFLRSTGSIFLNIGDTYEDKSLAGIPSRFARAAQESGWTIRNEIIWTKKTGVPSSAKDRLVPRHEQIYHLVADKRDYYYDLHAYSNLYGNGSNPGDIWRISHDRNTGGHLAPFPEDLVQRAITLACPSSICTNCGTIRRRQLERGLTELNTNRPQAERALEIYHDSDELTLKHIRAIQAVGISDVGKAEEFQSQTGENSQEVREKAQEAKEILGGYFREFTFPEWTTAGWSDCACKDKHQERGRVFDPFVGSGTTVQVALSLGYNAFGTDLDTSNITKNQALSTYSE